MAVTAKIGVMDGLPTVTVSLNEYGVYRRLPQADVDCSAMRPLTEHLVLLAKALPQIGPNQLARPLPVEPGVYSAEVRLATQWLRLSAGLQHVDVDLSVSDGMPYLCSSAMDYLDAENTLTAQYATEFTRLQFAWNALERLLRVLPLDPVTAAPGNFNSATQLLADHFSEPDLPPHFGCVLKHLSAHMQRDPVLAGIRKLQRSLDETPWRTASGMLLAAANQLRHVPAHGDLTIPQPETWGEDADDQLPRSLHPPRLAVRGLALSTQMLFAVFVRDDAVIDPQELWPEWDGPESAAAESAWPASRILAELHLEQGDGAAD